MIAVVTPKSKQRSVDKSHVLFRGASWGTYESILKDYDEIPQRINFNNGVLELMTLSAEHEQYSRFLMQLVSHMCVERRIRFGARGSNTLKQMQKLKGCEPDECFYIANESKIRGKKRIDMKIDPPPDLVIDVDIAHHVVDREAIYAAFGVPEMWKFDGKVVTCHKLVKGAWQTSEHSMAFPFLVPADLTRFLKKLKKHSDMEVLFEFKDWLGSLKR